MRLSELLGAEVRDRAGERVGTVTDVRLVQDGPLLASWGAALAVEGLVVSPRRAGSWFGFERSRVSRPAVLKALFSWLHRGTRFVEWEQVAEVGENGVRLACGAARLGPVPPLS